MNFKPCFRWIAFVPMSALLTIILPGGAQDVTINAAEFQSLVYSGHLMTAMDGKPELEACLQVLLELHRRNSNAHPAALADVSREALARYRTNTPIHIRVGGFSHEIPAA